MKLRTLVPQIGASTRITGVTVLRSGRPGPRVGLMGMLHGNELAGLGLWRLAEQLGEPARGEIYLIVGHPAAMTHPDGPVRYIERDINRMFSSDVEPVSNSASPDHVRCLELMPILGSLDVLIDIHSTSSPSDPFVIVSGDDLRGARLCASLPLCQVYGLESFIAGTAANWLVRHGGIAVTVEVGQHESPNGPELAQEIAYSILKSVGMIERPIPFRPSRDATHCQRHILILNHVKSVRPSFRYTRPFANFDHLGPGEIIGWEDGQSLRAPDIKDAVIFMPAAERTLRDGANTDAFFVGIEMSCFVGILGQTHLPFSLFTESYGHLHKDYGLTPVRPNSSRVSAVFSSE